MDEKDFTNTLYAVIQRLFEQPRPVSVEDKDFAAFLKCMEIVFLKRKQIAVETINAFVKRLALLQLHLEPAFQAAVLLLIKQILGKYASARSAMLDFEDDSVNGGFGQTPGSALYRGDINDPQLANASQCPAVFELSQTFHIWSSPLARPKNSVNLRLARGILLNEQLSGELLTITPMQLYIKVLQQTTE